MELILNCEQLCLSTTPGKRKPTGRRKGDHQDEGLDHAVLTHPTTPGMIQGWRPREKIERPKHERDREFQVRREGQLRVGPCMLGARKDTCCLLPSFKLPHFHSRDALPTRYVT